MVKTAYFLMCLVVSSLLCGVTAQQQTAPALTTYHDTALGLSYSYPATFVPYPKVAAMLAGAGGEEAADKQEQADRRCFSVPVSAVSQTASEFALVVMLRIDHACLGADAIMTPLADAAQQITQKMLNAFGRSATEDAVSYQMERHPAAFVQGSAPAPRLGANAMMHAGTVCTEVAKNTVCWLVLDTNHKAMPGLVANPVTFDGHAPVPLVPSDVRQAW